MSRTRRGAGFSGLLDVDRATPDGSVASLQSLWQKILEQFVAPLCTTFGFDSIQNEDGIARIDCFEYWQPPLVGTCRTTFRWTTPARGEVTAEESYALFRCDAEVAGLLSEVQIDHWAINDPGFPADRLYFHAGERLLLRVEPFELSLQFHGLTDDELDVLTDVDPELWPALREVPGSVTSEVDTLE